MSVRKICVLLAEDHQTVRQGLKLMVNSEPDMEVVGEAGDGRAAGRLTKELKPDVVVMDVSMPEWNGLKATEKLKEVVPQVKVLTLTRHTDDGFLQQLLRAGVSGYVLKQSHSDELIRAIRVVADDLRRETMAVVERSGCVHQLIMQQGQICGIPGPLS